MNDPKSFEVINNAAEAKLKTEDNSAKDFAALQANRPDMGDRVAQDKTIEDVVLNNSRTAPAPAEGGNKAEDYKKFSRGNEDAMSYAAQASKPAPENSLEAILNRMKSRG